MSAGVAAGDTARSRASRVDARYRHGVARWVVLGLAVIVAVGMLSPFIIMVLNAFKSAEDYSQNGPLSIPKQMYVGGLINFWNRTQFPIKLWNSIMISGLVALFGTILSLVTSYAIGIGRIKGHAWIIAAFLVANMLPQEAIIYPLFTMANAVGLSNSQWSVIIIFTVIQSAFGIYLLSSVLSTFPRELLEAAEVDGAGRFRILWSVVYPLVRPTLGVLMVFFFIWTWNEFFIPLVMLTSNDTQTVPIALASMQGDRMMDAPTTNAGALVSLLPALIFFLIFQRTLTRGVTAGALK